MVNREKVLHMTKMASYEAGQGKRDRTVSGYFRGDYIGMQMILSFVVITAAFAVIAGAYVGFHFEDLMESIYTMDLVSSFRQVLRWYLTAAVAYLAVTYLVYSLRYRRARRRLDLLLSELESLEEESRDLGKD